MCGIAGLFNAANGAPVDSKLLHRMTDSLVHRGPDASGFFEQDGVGLGHRRLSIIDLSGGQQPLFNEDNSVVVTFVGEIYNFKDLTQELKDRGHRFQTQSDTEVIVHGWEEWGADCVQRFRGMFTFALWDRNQQVLFLARDRLGIKPLYYTLLEDGTFLYGSELKALLQDPRTPRKFDSQAVEDYCAYGYIPDPKTIYQGIYKLPPGYQIELKKGARSVHPRQYWDFAFAPNHRMSEAEAEAELYERLREAVDIRMVADVPLGAFLSGGVDSSSVVAMMAEVSSDPVNTCSIGFGRSEFDESRYADQVAEQFGTNHHSKQVEADSFGLLDELATFYDEPFADSSAMPTYWVCRLARERVTVALSGDGGDEAFAGYRRYRWHNYEERVRQSIPQAIRGPLFGVSGQLYPKMDWAPRALRAKSTLQALARDSAAAYFSSVSMLNDGMRQNLFSDSFQRGLQGYRASSIIEDLMRDAPADHPLDKVIYADFKTYLPGDILTKVDRASMANSLEVRVPILDHHLVEWAATLPLSYRLRGREGKYILKKTMERKLSNDILYRDKMGFAVPLGHWFRGPLKETVRAQLLDGRLADTGFFDVGFVGRMLDEHSSGLKDYSTPIWSMVMFESFLRNVHEEGRGRDSVPQRSPQDASAVA